MPARLPRREGRGGAGGEAGRKGEISEAELYQLLGSQHRHKFVLKVEKPGGRRAFLYKPGSLNKWGCTVAVPLFTGHSLFERINNISTSTLTFPRRVCLSFL